MSWPAPSTLSEAIAAPAKPFAGNAAPTLHERESYCSTSRHPLCPTLVARVRTGHALSEPEYYAVWTGDAELVQQQLKPAL